MKKQSPETSATKFSKVMIICRLEIHHLHASRYLLALHDPDSHTDEESKLLLTDEDMVRFRLDPREDLVGSELELLLTAISSPKQARNPDLMHIKSLTAIHTLRPIYQQIPPTKFETQNYQLKLETPISGGTISIVPSTYYELTLALSQEEYQQATLLDTATVFQLLVRPVKPHFRDLTLTWEGTLADGQIFPPNYAEQMSALAGRLIAWFDGDIDVVCHACGLEADVDDEAPTPNADGKPERRTWSLEFFAIESYDPDEWEAGYRAHVAEIDTELRHRYKNRLEVGRNRRFYDELEVSTWMQKRRHAVDEASVGLRAGNVLRDHVYLPSIFVSARSVGGNRKACEALGAALCQEATRLFGVRFDRVSLDVDESKSF